jgi:RNA polymerase sigma-70 factor, ECF subfamily
MSHLETIAQIQKNDKTAIRSLFETYYGKLSAIALRYAKNQAQADEMIHTGLNNCLNKLRSHKQPETISLDTFIEREFILECISYIKNIRSEYYVSSTVYATETPSKNYDLFESNDLIDFNNIDNDLLVKSIQQLVPSQRLIFNLHVVDGYALPEAAAILESSLETVKSNLEKSRFNLQKNIEKSLKSIKS